MKTQLKALRPAWSLTGGVGHGTSAAVADDLARVNGTPGQSSLQERVRRLVTDQVNAMAQEVELGEGVEQLLPGKMLRTRLAAEIQAVTGADIDVVANMCAAVEMAHTATLCHDDVIDNALIRRAAPSLWRVHSHSAAILIGDALICRALLLVSAVERGSHTQTFAAKLWEVCRTEARQELVLRGSEVPADTCLAVARGKTGPLFALPAMIASGSDVSLALACEEAGYCLGTAYQLTDDLIDETGRDADAGKTLGTDRERGKFTLASEGAEAADASATAIREQFRRTRDALAPWPLARAAVQRFIECVLVPLFERQTTVLNLRETAETPQ
jgi:geranylgeranyl pyrophosphate synthase